jgi:hypothetical protein
LSYGNAYKTLSEKYEKNIPVGDIDTDVKVTADAS